MVIELNMREMEEKKTKEARGRKRKRGGEKLMNNPYYFFLVNLDCRAFDTGIALDPW